MKLTIRNLNKTYDDEVQALRNLSLELGPGIFGLLGPNGAGKSTLMRTLATLQQPDSGEIQLGEWDLLRQPGPVRRVLGYLPQSFGVYPKVSAWDLLDHFAVLKGLAERRVRHQTLDQLLQLTNLHADRNRAVHSFSGGMLRRWGIAQALLGDPKLIIVDEPTAGLDPEERSRFQNLLGEISRNVIVLLSTHIVHDVAELCRRMAVLHRGTLLVQGEPPALVARLRNRVWTKLLDRPELAACQARYPVLSTGLILGETQVRIYAETDPGSGFAPASATLEDVYFAAIAGHYPTEVPA